MARDRHFDESVRIPGAGELQDAGIRYRARVPARSAVVADWPGWVPAEVREACKRLRIDRPWRHQAEAADHVWSGRPVVITTGTASGKSLAYLLPILTATAAGSHPSVDTRERGVDGWSAQTWRRRPHTALYLAPTKALAHDQLRTTRELGGRGWPVAVVDGDTEPDERDWARDHAAYVLTNPDLLHHSLLPQHQRWAGFLRGLRYVVVDEAHRYGGVFGAQVSAVLRRLRRLAAHHGADPTFVLASATVSNVRSAAAALTGLPPEDFAVVEQDGSPRGPLDIVLREPEQSPEDATADLLADDVRRGRQVLAFVRSRLLAELVAVRAADRAPEAADTIAAYRAGYLATERRQLEQGLRDGRLRGVASTNALELGVDIAGVDAVIQCGYPGSRAAFWQQAGRAGRRGAPATVTLVARRHPLDSWVFDHPETLLDAPVEATVIHPDNPYVLGPQLLVAAQELPVHDGDEAYFGATTPSLVRRLGGQGLLRRRPDGWYWTRPERAADGVSLRSGGGPGVEIVEEATGRVLARSTARPPNGRGPPGAVYLHRGETYLCDDLDVEAGEALVRAARPGYITQPQLHEDIRVTGVHRSRSLGAATVSFGDVEIDEQVTSYLRRDEVTAQVWDETPLDLPVRTLRTAAVWWAVDDADDASLHAAEHVAVGILPVLTPCDPWDLGSSSDADGRDGSVVFVHDRQPGGSGFAEHAYQVVERWLQMAADRVTDCRCAMGVPACVISGTCGSPRPLDKTGAARLLARVTG